MRADLDEGFTAVFDQTLHRRRKKHRLPEIARPVERIELRSIGDRVEHGRINRDRRDMRLHLFQRLHQLVAQWIHLRTVRGEVHLHHPAEDVAGLKLFEYLRERRGIARQHRRCRTGADRD